MSKNRNFERFLKIESKMDLMFNMRMLMLSHGRRRRMLVMVRIQILVMLFRLNHFKNRFKQRSDRKKRFYRKKVKMKNSQILTFKSQKLQKRINLDTKLHGLTHKTLLIDQSLHEQYLILRVKPFQRQTFDLFSTKKTNIILIQEVSVYVVLVFVVTVNVFISSTKPKMIKTT